ncbi:hypothetical protein ACFJIW_20700 [Tahibacter sp. UC22_41]|uniref:hypothetical protein n=1 Tax=Tahibacter sp. UC22_41 TaxID=3350178 RepID=UPI0036D87A75
MDQALDGAVNTDTRESAQVAVSTANRNITVFTSRKIPLRENPHSRKACGFFFACSLPITKRSPASGFVRSGAEERFRGRLLHRVELLSEIEIPAKNSNG